MELRITYYKQKYMATGVKVLPQHWKEGYMVRDRMDAEELNEVLNMMMKQVRCVVNEMMKEGCVSLNEIAGRLERMRNEGRSFIEFCEERAQVRAHGLSEDSVERYERFLKFFRKWGKIVWFGDVTDRNIVLLDEYLNAQGMKPYSKWNNYHRFLNSFILDAMDEGYLKRNPYKWVKIEKEKSKGGLGKYLSAEEFNAIKKAKGLTASLEQVRDVFVFQVYTCMSYTDLAAFDADNIIEDRKGRKMYIANRGKTDVEFRVMLLPQALEILNKYDGKLPVISNVKYNAYLKVLAQYAGIDKPVTTHWARHTGATLLLNMGVDMEIVAKVLGHSSTKITREVYAKLLDDTIADAMEAIEGKI